MGQRSPSRIISSFLLCTLILLISSTYPCGRYIEDRPLTSSFLYFLLLVVIGFISVWINKKQACLLILLHAFTLIAAFTLVYTTSTSCPYVFSKPSLSDISLDTVATYFHNLTDRVEVFFEPKYTGGNFRFLDGEVVLDMIHTVDHPRTTTWRMAPLVPSLAQWNRSRDSVPAWVVAPLLHFWPDASKTWSDRSLREGYLLFSDQWKLGAIQEYAKKHRIKTPPIVPIFQWRDVDEAFNYAVVYLVLANALLYPMLMAVCVATWYYKKRVLDPQEEQRTELRSSYLLKEMNPVPWYGSK